MQPDIIQFNLHQDDRGKLVAVEDGKEIPFQIRRVYYIYDTSGDVRRGFHSHKELEQVLICLNGSCKILIDNGEDAVTVELDAPDKGLYISHNIWREMYDFSEGSVLLVLASRPYDEDDYIRDYQEFLKYVGIGGRNDRCSVR